MAEALELNLDKLIRSAAQVDGHTEELACVLVAVSNRVAAAQWGWRGSSATALAATMDSWLSASTTLVHQVGTLGWALNEAALRQTAAEAHRVQIFADVVAAREV